MINQTALDAFHKALYLKMMARPAYYRGVPVVKMPIDLWMYQELIHELRPDFIVETGTAHGGSALYFADLLDLAGHGKVISVDCRRLDPKVALPAHERISYLLGDSIQAAPHVLEMTLGAIVLLSLDSAHTKEHVLGELEAYAPAARYIVVEDTNIGRPVTQGHFVLRQLINNGPGEAVDEFLAGHPEWERDPAAERWLTTFFPGGWLRRV